MKQHRIVIRLSDIAQAEADIKAMRASARRNSRAAAEALQEAVDRTRLQALCPDLYEAGSLFPQRDDVIAAGAVRLFQLAA